MRGTRQILSGRRGAARLLPEIGSAAACRRRALAALAGLGCGLATLLTGAVPAAAQQPGPEAAAANPSPDDGLAAGQPAGAGPAPPDLISPAPAPAPLSLAQLTPGIEPVTVPRPGRIPEEQGPVGVLERERPELAPLGIQTKWGLLSPSATGSAVFDTNIFATQTRTSADLLLHFHPEIKLDSGQGILQYLIAGYGEFVKYAVHDSLSNPNGGATAAFTYSPTNDFTFQSQTGAKYGHQDPASFAVSVPNAVVKSLPPYSVLTETMSGTREFNRLGISMSGGFQREDYSNITIGGITFDQAVLDADAFSIGPKLSYALTPLTRGFLQAEYLRREYDNPFRNSNTYTFTLGTDFELTRLTKGSVFAGYRVRQYDAAAIGTVSSPSYGINVAWFPSELLTVLASGKQDFADTTVTTTIGIPAVLDIKTFKAEADYELQRQLVVTVSGAFENDNYGGAGRMDNTAEASAVMTYTLSRNAAVFGQYKFTDRLSSTNGFNYDRHQVGLGLRVQY